MSRKRLGTSGMGALPLLIILGLVFGAGYFLLKGDIKLPFFDQDKTLEMRRLDGFQTSVAVSGDIDKQRKVIKNEEELINFLAHVDISNALTVDEKIDFEKEYLIGVSSKTLETSDHEMRIKKIYIDREKDSLLISARLYKPGDNCSVRQTPMVVVDLVAISKTDKKISFETLKETKDCK